MRLCNGENRVSEIAFKLGKHQPNISAVITKLKKGGLVTVNAEKKPQKVFDKIQIKL